MRKLVKRLNARVCDNVSNGKFITLFIARYNMLTGHLTYVNAGHLPPIVYNAKHDKMIELEQGCIGLGMLDEIPGIEVGSMLLGKGTRLIAFTDGLVEINEGQHVHSSTEKLKEILRTSAGIDEAITRVQALADEHLEKGLAFDDVSVLGMEVTKGGLLSW